MPGNTHRQTDRQTNTETDRHQSLVHCNSNSHSAALRACNGQAAELSHL